MEHIVRFNHGYDCIRFKCSQNSNRCKPGSGSSHGRHGLSILFVSKGEQGAVQFLVGTGLLPQHEEPSSIGVRHIEQWNTGDFLPLDLGYHSMKPMYEGQPETPDCEWCDGQPCYYDGSGLSAVDAMYALVNGGDEAVWNFLDAYYDCVFNDAPYPKPAEYPKPLRKER